MSVHHVVVFLTSFALMTVELAASRLLAPHLGSNLVTWTSVIGVVLMAMGLGALAGGWLADRAAARRQLPLVLPLALLVGGLATSAIIPLLGWAADLPFYRLPLLLQVVAPVLVIFFLPAFVMATVPPMAYKSAVRDMARTGTRVGQLAAAHALGGIGGTFATGFWLVPSLGSRPAVVGVAALLVGLAAWLFPWPAARPWWPRVSAVAAIAALTAALFLRQPAFLAGPCLEESAYFCLRITTTWASASRGRVPVKQLVLDRLVHSGISQDEPDFLWYNYEKIQAWILNTYTRGTPGVFFIGGGGYVLPHWVERHFPGSRVEVAEIDPAVTRIALQEFIPSNTAVITHTGDARQVLRDLPSDRVFDVVVGDAFNDVSVPFHLTTVEFVRLVHQHLGPRGVYMANLIDRPGGPFAGAFTRSLAQVFPYVYVIDTALGAATPDQSSTVVVVAAMAAMPWDEMRPAAPMPLAVQQRHPDGPHRPLTDDRAPVDNLLLPVFVERWGWGR